MYWTECYHAQSNEVPRALCFADKGRETLSQNDYNVYARRRENRRRPKLDNAPRRVFQMESVPSFRKTENKEKKKEHVSRARARAHVLR